MEIGYKNTNKKTVIKKMLKFIQACSSLLLFQLLSPGCRTTALRILNQFLEVPAQVILVWGCFLEWWFWGERRGIVGFFSFLFFFGSEKERELRSSK